MLRTLVKVTCKATRPMAVHVIRGGQIGGVLRRAGATTLTGKRFKHASTYIEELQQQEHFTEIGYTTTTHTFTCPVCGGGEEVVTVEIPGCIACEPVNCVWCGAKAIGEVREDLGDPEPKRTTPPPPESSHKIVEMLTENV